MAPRRCNFRHPRFEDGQCPRPAKRAWTMCPSHYSAGRALLPKCTRCGQRRNAAYHVCPPKACQCMQEPDGQGGEHVAVHSSDCPEYLGY